MPATAYIALGSNLDDRQEYLRQALCLLGERPDVTVVRHSSFHETAPVGGPLGQSNYLNAVAELRTDLSARELLTVLLTIEKQLGRERSVRFGPRTLDLDLLLFDNAIIQESDLEVPHPRLHRRAFVLLPLLELAPEVSHPVLGKTVRELCHQLIHTRAGPLLGLRALVTGSTSGIGRAIACTLAREGAEIIVHGRREAGAAETVATIEKNSGQARWLLADLADPAQCSSFAQTAWTSCGPLDIWVNNAGADTLTGEARQWPFERKLESLWQVDVRATVILGRAAGQLMKQRGSGVLLNMGWDQAETGMEGDSGELFAATKGAIMSFTRSLALSLAPEVRVYCLAPGWIRTSWGAGASEYWQERVRRETPLRRWGTPEDVAEAACWLADPRSSYLTGQIVRVNGGAVR